MKRQDSNILYHYTNFKAFDGIVKDMELRANNVLYMNDAKEMRLFMEALEKAVCDRLNEDGCDQKAIEVRKLFQKERKHEYEYSSYAVCFSEYRDDAAQWERYGNSGMGVCLGFKKDVLSMITDGKMVLEKVCYQDDVKEHQLVNVISELVKNDCSVPVNGYKSLNEAVSNAWACSTAFKHPSFECEKEVRLLTIPSQNDYYGKHSEFHVTAYRIKKYFPLDLRKLCEEKNILLEDLIDEVIIGPESTQPAEILEDYLRRIGLVKLSERVHHSDCPLR